MKSLLQEVAADARWPLRLAEAFERLRAAADAEQAQASREQLWVLLYFGLWRCLRAAAARRGAYEPFDLEDIASRKSLDLLRQAESGKTDLAGKSTSDVVAFLSAVARHGLLDLKRQEGRSAAALPLDEQAALSGKPVAGREGAADPEGATEAGEFARALRSCAEGLSPRSLRIWYFRVLLDMSSREIADHPEVALKASHVDVLLHRIRTVIQECMEKRGQRWGQLPPGTFTLIWELISRCGQDTGPGGEDD